VESGLFSNGYYHFIARTTQIDQSHTNGRSRARSARDSNVHLVQPIKTGRFAEPQDFSQTSADDYLWRDDGINRQTQ
jgi:hypothetical protein